MPKADKKSKASKDGKKSKQAKEPAPAVVNQEVPEEGARSLDEAAQQLGPPDRELERALRSGHSDAELQREGARVASERILADGERLCSKALAHLDSNSTRRKETV